MVTKGLVFLPNDRRGNPYCIVPFWDQMIADTVQDHAQFGEAVHPPDAFQGASPGTLHGIGNQYPDPKPP